MNIGFIGAGKVGCAFGKYLYDKGFKVKGYFSKSFSSSLKGAKLVKGKAFNDINFLVKESDIIFITTPDDVIKETSKTIAGLNLSLNKIFIHMSGALSSSILRDIKDKGGYVYSLHPLQSFADIKTSVKKLSETVFSLEGDDEKKEVIKDMLKKLDNKYFLIDSEKKPIYHASACVLSNYLVTLLDYGFSYLEEIGIDKKEANEAFYPLISVTLENVRKLGTKKALTGPIKRGDLDTIKKHIESIKKESPELLKTYKVLGLETLKLTGDEKFSNELKNILKEV